MATSTQHVDRPCREKILIGIGNEYRGDDGLGLLVAREIRRRALPGLRVIEASGEGTALIATWQGAHCVLVVDAVTCGQLPGTLYRFDASRVQIPTDFFHYSSHTFGLAEAIEMARNLHELPPAMFVYGIEGQSYESEVGLSAVVLKCVPSLIHLIEKDLQAPARMVS